MADFKPSRQTVSVTGVPLTEYSTSGTAVAVPDTTVTTILTQAFILGIFENLTMISVSGEDYAKFLVVVNGTTIDTRRSGPDRNLTFDFSAVPYKLVAGDIVDIKVEHFVVGALINFEATVYGYA